MRDVAIVAFAQYPNVRAENRLNDTEMVVRVLDAVTADCGIDRKDMGFTCSGSTDYLSGLPFSFVSVLDAVGPWPPVSESHVEMDGAWALYEAWVRMQHEDIETALVYSFGKSSTPQSVRDVMTQQLDPYVLAPLGPDSISLAALQARALLDTGRYTERDFAAVSSRSRRDAQSNPDAQLKGDFDVETILRDPYIVAPLRKHDCPPLTDGAAAVVLAAGKTAKRFGKRAVWIRGIDHRIEPHSPGARDLTASVSTALAGKKAGGEKLRVDIAELHAPFAPQELILREALGLDGKVVINPSGGALAANPIMSAGLARFGEAARRIQRDEARRALAHATSGPLLQQNMVAVLEGGV